MKRSISRSASPSSHPKGTDVLTSRHRSKETQRFLMAFVFLLFVVVPCLRGGQNNGVKQSESEENGKKLFFQRCSLCHLGMPTKYRTYGPILSRDIVEALGDEVVRERIMEGSARMPGFKYTLTVNEVDGIIAYLKTVKAGDVAKASSAQ